MTITLSPETEAKLRQRAESNGQDLSAVVEALIGLALEWEEREREEAIAGIQRGLEASDAGRTRPADVVVAEMRARSGHYVASPALRST